ncbi:hypothetical protein [uncultured Nostoc sp.]
MCVYQLRSPMPKLVTIQPDMRVEELEQRYRQCSDVVESRH